MYVCVSESTAKYVTLMDFLTPFGFLQHWYRVVVGDIK